MIGRVVGGDEAVEDRRRNDGRGGIAAAQLQQVVAGPLQATGERQLTALEDPQQFVDPGRIVVGGHDEFLDAHQAGRVLPAAGLAKNVEAADVPAHDPALAEFLRRLRSMRRQVALRRGHELGKQIDVPLLLDRGAPTTQAVCSLAWSTMLSWPRGVAKRNRVVGNSKSGSRSLVIRQKSVQTRLASRNPRAPWCGSRYSPASGFARCATTQRMASRPKRSKNPCSESPARYFRRNDGIR